MAFDLRRPGVLFVSALAPSLIVFGCGPNDNTNSESKLPDDVLDMMSQEDMRSDLFVPLDLGDDHDARPDQDTSADMPDDMPQGARCERVVCQAGQACQDATGICTLPQSCADRQAIIAALSNAPLPSNNFYQLFVDGDSAKPWWAWCDAMRTNSPREYLPLAMTHEHLNTFERFGEPSQLGSPILSPTEPLYQRRLTRTRYEKVRINPYTLEIDVLDPTFSSTEVFQDRQDNLDKFMRPVPFGTVQGCALQIEEPSLRQDAVGRLDLRNTPFKLSQQWGGSGVCVAQVDFSASSQNQVISLNVSGGSRTSTGCGVVAPRDMLDAYSSSGCDTPNGQITPAREELDRNAPLYAIKLSYLGGEGGMTKPRPKTCAEALVLGTCISDGPCNLYVGRRADKIWKAKCVDMTTAAPKTYIEINKGDSMDNHTSQKINASGITTSASFYGSLLLDGHSLRADITDTRFAVSTAGGTSPQISTFGVSENCVQFSEATESAFARARLTLEETENGLRFATRLAPYGECVTFQKTQNGASVTIQGTPIFGPVSMEELIFGGGIYTFAGPTRPACGGLAPEPYAIKQGYFDCRERRTGQYNRYARHSTQDKLLFEFAHESGNP